MRGCRSSSPGAYYMVGAMMIGILAFGLWVSGVFAPRFAAEPCVLPQQAGKCHGSAAGGSDMESQPLRVQDSVSEPPIGFATPIDDGVARPVPVGSSLAAGDPLDSDQGRALASTRFWVDAERGIVCIVREERSPAGSRTAEEPQPAASGLVVDDPDAENSIEAQQWELEWRGNTLRVLLCTRGPRVEPTRRRAVPEITVWFNGRACATGYLAESDADDVGVPVFESLEVHLGTKRLVARARQAFDGGHFSGQRAIDLEQCSDFLVPGEVLPDPQERESDDRGTPDGGSDRIAEQA